MKLYLVTLSALFCVVLTGCDANKYPPKQAFHESMVNRELITSYNNISIQNAIISQHTLFPYHFVNNSDKLNELGMRDLRVLAKHFTENPGDLNVRRGNTPDALYQARVKFVLGKMQENGVDNNRIKVSDGMAGGSGVLSEKVLVILQEESENDRPANTTSSRVYDVK